MQLRPLTLDVAEQLAVPVQERAIGAIVEEGAPADQAGLRASDILIEAEGRPVTSVEDVLSVLRRSKPEDRLSLTVMRDAERRNITVTAGHRPN